MNLLRVPQVAAKLACCETYVWILSKRPDFPRPVKLSATRHTTWIEQEIDEWVLTQRHKEIFNEAV